MTYNFFFPRYLNALEVASGSFAASVKTRVVLRKEEDFSAALKKKKESNCKDILHVFVLFSLFFIHANVCPSLTSISFYHSVYIMWNS